MALALSACAAAPREPITPVDGSHTNHAPASACDARTLSWTVGLVADDALIERARIEAGATTVRVLRPGMMITNEVNPTRLNLRIDNARKVLAYSCG
ncbi:I78 family peptidase inhibitor [Cognatiluteimonas profundi]|uniref:I78 family peptidase inhibitor n=1 Tax=Cognatiluteimonas profundi TaxID=2594501 RepID=UPI00131C6ACF|nr:I78 family peptidase inhibitor [Lysobacter profundi]